MRRTAAEITGPGILKALIKRLFFYYGTPFAYLVCAQKKVAASSGFSTSDHQTSKPEDARKEE
jgi:hypothetical protein